MKVRVKSFAECEAISSDLYFIPRHVLILTAGSELEITRFFGGSVLIGGWDYPFCYLELPLMCVFDDNGRMYEF